TKAGEHPAVVALVGKKTGLVFAPRRDTETHAMLGDDFRQRRFRRLAVERFPLLHVLFPKPIKPTPPIKARKRLLQGFAEPIHAGRKKLEHHRRAETVYDQAA